MSKYLSLSKPISWLKEQFIGDVPPEDAFCEFDCDRSHCDLDYWVKCKRRLAYLELRARWHPGDEVKSPRMTDM